MRGQTRPFAGPLVCGGLAPRVGQEEPEPYTHRELYGERGAEIGRALGSQATGRYIGEAIGSAVNATVGPVDPNDIPEARR